MNERVLAVGAHPDDIELGCGGTLVKHRKNNDEIYSLVMTRGERGKHCPELSECKASADYLGIEIIFLDFKDAELSDDYHVVSRIEEYVKKINPTIVYTHTTKDRHQDHRNCSNAAKSAVRNVPKVLLFESPSTQSDFSPHIYSNITGTIEDKLETLRRYNSQIEKGIVNLDWITAQALYWGLKNIDNFHHNGKNAYAEAFEINHFVF